MLKKDLEIKIQSLEKELKTLKDHNRYFRKVAEKQAVGRYEVIHILQNHSINDCTDEFFCFRSLTAEERTNIENNESFKAIAKNDCHKRSFFKYLDTEYDIYGFIDEEDYDNANYSATVFAAPPNEKEFRCVVAFGDFMTLIGARLALAILFIMMNCNECSITRMHSANLNEAI